jgi:hypothetical protein
LVLYFSPSGSHPLRLSLAIFLQLTGDSDRVQAAGA